MKIALRVLVWVAIGGLVYWFTSHLAFKEVQVNAPLEGDARYNPFYAAIRLSSELGAEATWETSNPIATRRSVTLVVMAGVSPI